MDQSWNGVIVFDPAILKAKCMHDPIQLWSFPTIGKTLRYLRYQSDCCDFCVSVRFYWWTLVEFSSKRVSKCRLIRNPVQMQTSNRWGWLNRKLYNWNWTLRSSKYAISRMKLPQNIEESISMWVHTYQRGKQSRKKSRISWEISHFLIEMYLKINLLWETSSIIGNDIPMHPNKAHKSSRGIYHDISYEMPMPSNHKIHSMRLYDQNQSI